MIYCLKCIWQIVCRDDAIVRTERKRHLGKREEDRQRGTLCHPSRFDGSWRENVLGVHKENTINYSLCSSFITQDYHLQSIHHIERVVCILHTCTAIWKAAGLRTHTYTHSVESKPKVINPPHGWGIGPNGLEFVCLDIWCFRMRHVEIKPQSILYYFVIWEWFFEGCKSKFNLIFS